MLALQFMPLLAALALPLQDAPDLVALDLVKSDTSEPDSKATLFTNATFYLGDTKGTRVSALLVEGGRVIEFGEEYQFAERRLDSDWEIVDLDGGFVIPGLQDSHVNVVGLGSRLREIDLTGIFETEAILASLREVRFDEGEWILAHGWEPAELPGPESELGARLTELYPANPVRIMHAEGTAAFLNRRALGAVGFDDERQSSLHGGSVERSEDGTPTGLVFGRALDRVGEVRLSGSVDELEQLILDAQEVLLSLGLTAVHDMGVGRESERAYRALLADGRLKMRVVGYLDGRNGLHQEWLERGPVEPDEQDRFCIQGVALAADGSLSLRTASLLRGYDSARHRKAKWLPSSGELRDRIASAMAAGLQPAVLATGDQACRSVLDVFEEVAFANPDSKQLRPRVEGALLASSKDWARFPQLGALPSMQPYEATTNWIERRLPEDQVRGAVAWRDVASHIGTFALGSRSPVRSPDPRVGLQAARLLAKQGTANPEDSVAKRELVAARAAVAGYTTGAAYAAHQEDRRGQLFEGYWADMTVFDRNPIEGPAETLLEAHVVLTIINGKVVWTADE